MENALMDLTEQIKFSVEFRLNEKVDNLSFNEIIILLHEEMLFWQDLNVSSFMRFHYLDTYRFLYDAFNLVEAGIKSRGNRITHKGTVIKYLKPNVGPFCTIRDSKDYIRVIIDSIYSKGDYIERLTNIKLDRILNKTILENILNIYEEKPLFNENTDDLEFLKNRDEMIDALRLYYEIENRNLQGEIKRSATNFQGQEEQLQLLEETSKKNLDEWKKQVNEMQGSIDRLEKTYDEKLKLKKPFEFWEEKAKEENTAYKFSSFIVFSLSLIIMILAYIFMNEIFVRSIDSFEKIKPFIPYSFGMVAIISFLLYLLRTAIKILLSHKHLETEYKQKSMFTYFYLSLLNDDKTKSQIGETEKNLIFTTLFNNPDSGLIKTNNDQNEINSLLTALLSKK